ncbi:hypothetical protein CEUSTIGMA_g7149.t1 [Chlamydomonas eustigma]|uniref:Long-chain-fatty-acid--CoA ligase n=1 Tax=Chlamydomonas eustigma TaxID=1157962 RepID=A0A250X9G4_9CHLO|nr:hypothetical protein CEUSTIGMA_g7149.t1 [Chlamydomonas eustigma]|eukprot:GAX79708.1 hypothetical protein CEUSTIGMA_g7149.t1 [Chlamydomonas eustigma]
MSSPKHEFPSLGHETLVDMFENSVKLYGNRPCLGYRRIQNGEAQPFEFMTYYEVSQVISAVGSAFHGLGLRPRDRIGVIGSNSPQWMMAMQAMNRMNLVCVPLYDTLGETAVNFIINHAETKLVVSSGVKLPTVAKALLKSKSVVTSGVVYWGTAPEETIQLLESEGFTVLSWEQLVVRGSECRVEPESRPQPEDLCTIMYTSGTTGDPKGVMISHRAVLSTIAGLVAYLEQLGEKMDCNDVFLSFLPLAHIFDRVAEELMLSLGGSIGYYQGDVKKLVDDIAALRPTLFAGVPRVFERIYNGVMEKVHKGSFFTQMAFNWAFGRKQYYMKEGWRHNQASTISDLLVFDKIKQRLGGRVRVIVCGGAPLSPAIEEFLKIAMCAPVVQGYGLTETCAGSFISDPFKFEHTGTVGAPLGHTELRLEAVPEMGYSPADASAPAGEICIRGPGVFTSYYKNEEMSKECFDSDGFFHTGDVGILTADGAIKIVDRKKNIFKLSHGEYIAVEKVENVFKHCAAVDQIWVYGNSMESMLVAVVVPSEGHALKWAADSNIPQTDFKEVCSLVAFNKYILDQLRITGKAAKLLGFEEVKAVHLEAEQFSIENDLMTPKFSLKRVQLFKRYNKEIDKMYDMLKQSVPKASK